MDKRIRPAEIVGDHAEFEQNHVKNIYDQIAKHFSHTRYKPWQQVTKFLQSFDQHALIGDIGSGNGKYLDSAPGLWIGGDNCRALLDCCAEKHPALIPQQIEFNILNLPYRHNLFDGIICIAVLHHLSSQERRLQALTEIRNVLKPKGRAIVYVWAFEQKVDSIGGRNFDQADCLVPWQLQGHLHPEPRADHVMLNRYYHVFTRDEVNELVIPGLDIINVHFDCNNWVVLYEKS